MRFKLFSRFLIVVAAAAMTFFSPMSTAQGADKYLEISPAQPTEPGKTEVLEFFAYSCPHCAVLEPLFAKWTKALPQDVVVRQVPVAFNASMRPQQQLFYALEAMNRMDLHPLVFQAIHEQKKRMFTKADIVAWVVDQGVDKAKFEAAFDSFGVTSKTARADQMTTVYKLQGTPSIAVAGRYLTSPSEAGGYQETIDVADSLVRKVRTTK